VRGLLPRERVLIALSHQETDRVPVDFMATAETWARLKSRLGMTENEEVLRHLGIDLRHPRQPYVGPPLRQHADGSWTDAWGVRRRPVPHENGTYDEIIHHPLAGVKDAGELAAFASASHRAAAATRGAVASQRKNSRRITWLFLPVASQKAAARKDRVAAADEQRCPRQVAREDQR